MIREDRLATVVVREPQRELLPDRVTAFTRVADGLHRPVLRIGSFQTVGAEVTAEGAADRVREIGCSGHFPTPVDSVGAGDDGGHDRCIGQGVDAVVVVRFVTVVGVVLFDQVLVGVPQFHGGNPELLVFEPPENWTDRSAFNGVQRYQDQGPVTRL